MINLFSTYFVHPNLSRHKEIDWALRLNLGNQQIDHIYLLSESDPPQNPKITSKTITKRPTFKEFFDWANDVGKEDDLSVIVNSDIAFDDVGL